MLGKRKRSTVVIRRSSNPRDGDHSCGLDFNTHDVFRKYFEAQFDPLPETAQSDDELDDISENDLEESSLSQDDDEFSGFSDQEVQIPVVEVVDATAAAEESNPIDKIFKKQFMSSKPPRDLERTAPTLDKTSKTQDDEDDVTNLKNDLDLQRLLRESHLLSQSTPHSSSNLTSLSLQGKQRHQATDTRLLGLGSKSSLYTQEKMPMSHRRGIQAKAGAAETRRRRDAKENGVILEKKVGTYAHSKEKTKRRERGVDVPVLGRFKGGTLSLSKRDISSIQGPSRNAGKKKGRR